MAEAQEKKDTNNSKIKRPLWKRVLRILGRITVFLLLLLFLLVLFIRSPWGQNIIVGKITKYVSQKTHTKVSIKKLFVTFTGDIDLQGLYLEDIKGDTLIYSEKLQVDIPLLPILQGEPISIDGLKWTGLYANINRKDSLEGFNYQFLIDAFSSDSTSTPKEKTSTEPPKISIGSIDLSNFKINYVDAFAGMEASLDLGNFHFEGKNFDLKEMKFQVSEMMLENTKLKYIQTKSSAPSNSTESVLPYLSLDNFKLKNVIAYYKSVPDSMEADLNLAFMELQVPKVDLSLQDIEVGKFALSNSSIQIKSQKQKVVENNSSENQDQPQDIEPFIWPNWDVKVKTIALQNNHFHYQVGEKSNEIRGFNPNYIVLNAFNFVVNDIELSKNESAKLDLKKLSFYEGSGIALNQLAFNAAIKSTEFSMSDLVLKAGNSSINTNLLAKFASIEKFIEKPLDAHLILDLKAFVVDVNDAFRILPELRKNEYLKKLSVNNLSGHLKAEGTMTQLNLSDFLMNWGQNTSIKTHGELMNLLNVDQLAASIDNFTFVSTRSDVIKFVSEKDLGISIPQNIFLQSQMKGKLDDFQAKALIIIPEGKIKIEGKFKQQNELAFAAKVNVVDLKLGKILKNPSIGMITFDMNAFGKGNNINDLDAELVSRFSKLEFNGYDFSALQLDGKLIAGQGNVSLKYKDENLDLIVDNKIKLDSVSPKIAMDFNMEGADLFALGLTPKQIKAKLIMNANFEGNSEQFVFDNHISEGILVGENSTYYLGIVDIAASANHDSTALDITSNFLNGKLRANADIDQTSKAIQHHLESYFSDSLAHNHEHSNPVKLQMKMSLTESKLLTDFLLPDIRTMDDLSLNIDFDQDEKTLNAHLNLPYIDYASKTVDSLKFDFNSTENQAEFKFGFNALNASPFVMKRTFLDGDLKNGVLKLNFNAFDGEKEMYVLRTEISGKSSDLSIHIDPSKLIFHLEEWSIPDDNQINIQNKKIIARNFDFSRENQRLRIANNLMQTTQNNIGIEFTNFKLENLLAVFNKDDLLASGNFQGSIVAINPLEKIGLNADFSIDSLVAMKAPLGQLVLKAKSTNSDKYDLDLGLKGEDVDVAVLGAYTAQDSSGKLDFNVNLNKIGMKTIAIISGESLKDASGNISGKLAINGNSSLPQYKGYLQFNEAEFNVSQLNSKFRLANDKINITNEIITLNQFSVEDEQNNKFIISGSILTENITDPEFDLTVNGKNFQVLNSTKEDNDLYYGSVNFDMDGTIKGKLSFPEVNLNIGINQSTNVTYVIPDSQAKLEKTDGIVEFVNKENPDNILTRNDNSEEVAVFGGIELHANLTIHQDANFNVIIDPQTGDNLTVSGVGALDFNIARNGRMTMSGRYDINGGHYSLSLYNLVKRKFELEPGSSVVWRGDPMDADLNVTAKYSLETSASALMAFQTAGASEEVQNKYRQSLPFFVYLNVSGELNQPKLDFRLDMPEDSRGAIDGTVYGRIKQLNTEKDALNKQVFSLLVLRKFYPNSGSDGSSGGAESIVRKNINEALSDQLNAFSDRLMGNSGVELDFGLNSYTDYQGESADQRTDLNVTAQKKLLDDRLIVQVGSNVNVEGDSNAGEENPVVGNASINYLLTKDGRWRLKGFRNGQYENVIDGQVFVNGIALIFQRQFNEWNELFIAPVKEEDSIEKSKTEKETEKNDKNSKTDKKAKE